MLALQQSFCNKWTPATNPKASTPKCMRHHRSSDEGINPKTWRSVRNVWESGSRMKAARSSLVPPSQITFYKRESWSKSWGRYYPKPYNWSGNGWEFARTHLHIPDLNSYLQLWWCNLQREVNPKPYTTLNRFNPLALAMNLGIQLWFSQWLINFVKRARMGSSLRGCLHIVRSKEPFGRWSGRNSPRNPPPGSRARSRCRSVGCAGSGGRLLRSTQMKILWQ